MMKLNDNTYIITVSTTLNNLDVPEIIKDSADSEIDNITGLKEPTLQPKGTVKAVPYKEKGTRTYYKVKEVIEIYDLQVVLFRVITNHKELAFKFEWWTDGTYEFAVWTGYNYEIIDVPNCSELDKVAMDVLEGLEYYLSSLNYSDEGKTLKFKIKDVISSVIIDGIDFKEIF